MKGRISLSLVMLIGIFTLSVSSAPAQYDDPRGFEPSTARYFSVGFLHRTFEPRPSNTTTSDSLRIAFTRTMPVFGFHQGPVDILFGFASYDHQGASRSTIFLATTVRTEIPLTRGGNMGLMLPVMIGADFTKAEAAGAERDNFNVASVGLGAGLKLRLRGDAIEFMVESAGLVQYAVEGFSTRTGFSGAVLAETSLLLHGVGLFEGLALGYRFRYQTWSLGGHQLDYRSVSHGPYVGLLF